MLTKIRAKRHSKLNTSIMLAAMVCLILMDCLPIYASATCPVIDDVPMGLQIKGSPPIIMFTIDDSGSMDFSITLENSSFNGYNHWYKGGQFNIEGGSGGRRAYIYNEGDDKYGRDFEGDEHLYWFTQFYETNKQFYNPSTTYAPWPRWNETDIVVDAPTWTDPNPDTSAHDMDPDNPRSNPIYNDWTLNMDGTYYTWSSGSGGGDLTEAIVSTDGAVIIDDSEVGQGITDEIIIDNCDAGLFTKSTEDGDWSTSGNGYDGGCGTTSFISSNSGEGTYNVKWEKSGIDTDAVFEVYAQWSAYDERGENIPYTIHYGADGSDTQTIEVNQEIDGNQWNRLGTGTYTFGSGTAKVTIDNYEVTDAGNGDQSDEISADAIRLVCTANCTAGDTPPFQLTGDWSDNTGDECLDADYTQSSSEEDCPRAADNGDYTATWTASSLDTSTSYDVYAWWEDHSSRSTAVSYQILNNTVEIATAVKNQRTETDGAPQLLASGLSFSSGVGVVKLDFTIDGNDQQVVADAVAFVPSSDDTSITTLAIKNAHYYVNTLYDERDNDGDGDIDEADENIIYLINLDNDYNIYEVTENADGKVVGLATTTAADAGLEYLTNRRSYAMERVNFANWFSFYRRRELTAKNALSNVITDMNGVFIGILTIHNRITQEALPVSVAFGDEVWDETDFLLKTLYRNYNSDGGTPLRLALKKTGEYFEGDTMDPDDIYPDGNDAYTTSTYYPFYPQGDGGECQQSFCILMTDGFWNGNSPSIGDEDTAGNNNTDYDGGEFADNESNTVADVAMRYYEVDLNTNLDNLVQTSDKDPAPHQRMITYGLSFGAKGTLDPNDYPNCPGEAGSCPTWPDPTNTEDEERIDDLYHAAINGRGLYLNAGNPEELLDAMNKLKEDIESRAVRTEASASVNSQELITGSQLYIGGYNSFGWAGVVTAWDINPDGSLASPMAWNAAEVLETRINDDAKGHSDRLIATYNGTAGVEFGDTTNDNYDMTSVHSDLTADVVTYVRGDKTNEQQNDGSFRNRKTTWAADADPTDFTLGDIIHSSPTYHDGVLYVGANDGMLHAFDASDGEELFAYVPALVHGNLKSLADSEEGHKYYVDLTPTVRGGVDITPADDFDSDISLLVGGLGKGGQGYFALDVTNADTVAAASDVTAMFLWEFDGGAGNSLIPDGPTGSTFADDMGYSFSRPVISRTYSDTYPYVVIFGNGYASSSGTSSLFIVNPADGSIIRYLNTGDTGTDTCNGMSSPFPADIDNDGYLDYIYVGDLDGNMWKIDMTSSDHTNWDFAFFDGATPKPLFTARDGESPATPQPITGRPDVTDHCSGIGQMVIFGTGQLMGTPDVADTSQQTFYGIWDYGEAGAADEYVGTFERPGSFSNWTNSDTITALGQTSSEVTSGGETLRVLTDDDPNWATTDDLVPPNEVDDPAPGADPPAHAIWYFDLPDTKERIIQNVLIQTGKALVVSNIPGSAGSVCSAGGAGSSYLQAVDPCTGGRTGSAVFDINDDGVIDETDMLTITDPDDENETIKVPATGVKKDGLLYAPAVVSSGETEYLYSPTDPLNPEGPMAATGAEIGMTFWRQHSD